MSNPPPGPDLDLLEPSSLMPPADVLARLASPALVVHLDLARANIRRVIELCGGAAGRWRPHLKTTKLPAVWRELVAAGVRQFKCATTREVAVLCNLLDALDVAGDVLLAHPLRGPGVQRLAELAAAHGRQHISVLCEDTAALAELPASISIFVDVNVGMDRTGIPIADLDAILAVARGAGPRLRGLHAYEGHLHQTDAVQREWGAQLVLDAVADLVRALGERGVATDELVTSGTPTLRSALAHRELAELPDTVHRVSPGTVVFHDARSAELDPELGLTPAAVVLARVVSHPAPGIVTCDAGSKSLAAEAGDPIARVLGHPELIALAPSEEHLPLRVAHGPPPARGTPLLLWPRHACPTVNLAGEALLLNGGLLVGLVPVLARGHATLAE